MAWHIILTSILLGFISCKKENPNAVPNLAGNWVFVSSDGKMNETDLGNGLGVSKVEIARTYTTTSGGGDINFTDTIISFSAAYTVHVSQDIKIYRNNVISSTQSDTFSVSQPVAVETVNFEIIGQDSIHFFNGGIPGSGGFNLQGNNNPPANDAKFIISGNVLTITSPVFVNGINGPTFSWIQTGSVVTTLKKQ